MARAINRWNIKSNRNINYRSFAPIIKLAGKMSHMIINNDGLLNDPVSAAGVSHTPECQMWAVWALANLTSVTPDKYCRWLSATSIILPTVPMPSWLLLFQTGAR